MKYFFIFSLIVMSFLVNSFLFADTCPDPATSSLHNGKIPAPWQANPFSGKRPPDGDDIEFVRVTILAANYGRGISCTYKSSDDEFAIWRQAAVRLPSRLDEYWVNSQAGFICSQSLDDCEFNIAQ